jgi:glycosyltransferase involved in cell wall biosynthesis
MFLKKAFRSGSLYQFLGNKYRAFIVSNFSYLPSSVVTVSDFSKHDILNTVRTLTPEKVFRTYQSYDSVFDELDKNESEMIIKNKLSISYPYILALGAVEPRKNTHAIIEVFARLKKKREIEQKLVIVGIPQNNHHFFHGLINSLNVQQDILLTNFISTKTLSALYQCSTMFLYPSLYEGFGIPLLEAMASGTPIITSNITSIPEVVGDAGILIDPTNLKQMEMSMVKLIDDQSLRLDLIAKGFKQVTNFSWQNMAKQTLEVYNIAYKR